MHVLTAVCRIDTSWHSDFRPIHCGKTAGVPELWVGTCRRRVEGNETACKQIVLRKGTDCNDNLSCPRAIPVQRC